MSESGSDRTGGMAGSMPLKTTKVAYRDIASFSRKAAWLACAEKSEAIRRFLPLPPWELSSFERRIESLRDRTGLSESLQLTLLAHNRRLGCSEATERNIGALADGSAFAIVTGQQPGLLGGPALVMHKAATAVALCRALQARGLGRFVPVFWSASEDHDASEFDSVRVMGRDGVTQKISLQLPERFAGMACSAIEQPGLMDGAIDEFLGLLPDNDFKPQVAQTLKSVPSGGPAESFAALLQRCFPSYGLVVVEPSFFRPEGLPIFEQEILDPDASNAAIRQAGAELLAAGFEAPLQRIEPTNLFFLDDSGVRRRIGWDGDEFSIQGVGKAEPADILSEVARISTNVALRPLVQDMALPVAAYVAGPAETAYLAQLSRLYPLFGLPAPLVFPRASATILTSRELASLSAAGVTLGQALSGMAPAHSVSPLPAAALGAFEEIESSAGRLADAAAAAIPGLHENLSKKLRGFAEHMARKAAELKDDIARSLDLEHAEKVRKAERAVHSACPGSKLQERAIAWLFYIARHGPLLPESLAASIDPFDFRHTVVEV